MELSLSLVHAVFETLYDIQKVTLPASTIEKEVKKQVHHVISSLIPKETIMTTTTTTTATAITTSSRSRRNSYISERSSVVDASPFGRDHGNISDTSLLGTPSSVSSFFTHDSKRTRTLPSLPLNPTDIQ